MSGSVPWTLDVARILAPLVSSFTAARALTALFRDQIRTVGLRFISDHVVVCGLGDTGISLVRSLRAADRRTVVIECDHLGIHTEQARESGALVIFGDAQDPGVLRRAGVETARHLVATCGADSTNAEIAVKATRLDLRDRREPLAIAIHIIDPELCVILRNDELTGPSTGMFTLDFFNTFERGARALLADRATSPLSRSPAPHIVVVGAGRLGSTLVVQAAVEWERVARPDAERLRISVVGRSAVERCSRLAAKFSILSRCRLEAVDVEVGSAAFEDAEFLADAPSAVYICINDDVLAVGAAMTVRNALADAEIPVVVRLAHATGLGALLGRTLGPGHDRPAVHAFCLLDLTAHAGILDGAYERMARARCTRRMRNGVRNRIRGRDFYRPSKSPTEPRPLTRETNSRALECGLLPKAHRRATVFRFTPAEIELLAMMEHDRWSAWLRDRGYRYGPERRDRSAATRRWLPWRHGRHPHLRTWEDLPEAAREINRASIRDLPDVLGSVDEQIIRLTERLPRAIHEAYVNDRSRGGAAPGTDVSLAPWDELPESLKDSNRDQAAHIRITLRAIGCALVWEGDDNGDLPEHQFSCAEPEALAEMEHERWVVQRTADGWSVGSEKDVAAKRTPYIVPWAALDEEVKDLDRDVIRRLPQLVRQAGYRIVRRDTSEGSHFIDETRGGGDGI